MHHSARHRVRVDPDVPDGRCPLTVARPLMVHRWQLLTFLHWAFEPDVVQRLLPPRLTVDTYDGRAWVGLVPFRMWVAPPGLPALPWLGRFYETNVRTYVRDRHGRAGVWFFSLEASDGGWCTAAADDGHAPPTPTPAAPSSSGRVPRSRLMS
jgi:uncharacterized protein YqjF (DUF2071 family)